MRRAVREHLRDFVAILALFLIGVVAVLVILIQQGVTFPSWAPGIGTDSFELRGEITSAQAVTPGQGQSVNINGVKVGEISNVQVEDGRAVVTMQVRDQYAPLIKTDATMLPRPRTGLNDMVIEVDPGNGEQTLEEGSIVPTSQTQAQVQPDDILATLDADTRAYLKLLLNGAGEALKGDNGLKLSAGLRRFEPFARDIARINSLLAERRQNIARTIHNFRLLSEALAHHDQELAQFVDSSNAVLGAFADQESAIRASLEELPGTLQETLGALHSSDELAVELTPALSALRPAVRALGPAQEGVQPFFEQTTPAIHHQIRPLTRQVRKPVRHLASLAGPLGQATKGLKTGFIDLNALLNELAFNPEGATQEGFLFWLTWLNHNANSVFLTQDAMGPLRRGIILESCQTARLAEATTAPRPFLKTLLELTRPPSVADICG
jgi:phospholipid/cholesterol/gamma-HCH transport system substrate-binding protein